MWSFLFRLYLRINRFEYTANFPKGLRKFVLIAAPHTSNFDFPLAKAAFYLMGIKVRFLAKSSLFKGFLGKLFHRWGGIPVQRDSRHNLVQELKEHFDGNQELALVLAPEGTRSAVSEWKSGYYHIAKAAGVPIVCGYLDYEKRQVGIGPIIDDLNDFERVKDIIRQFYSNISPRIPENYNPNFI